MIPLGKRPLRRMLAAMRGAPLLLLAALAGAAEPPPLPPMPPSPSTAPGIRIWPPPAFTHWPAIAYADESRNAAVGVPVQKRGAEGAWRWEDGPVIPLRLPDDVDQTSGLVDLRLTPGVRTLIVTLPEAEHRLPLRVVPAGGPWPIARLTDGYPVDSASAPVVLLTARPQPARERTWALVKGALPRPAGRALVVGDPLTALHDSPWQGLDAETRPATDLVKPHHACLAALAVLPDPLPRTIVWCPGNGAIRIGLLDPEEPRLLGALRERCQALGAMPLLILALPPKPVEERLHEVHAQRREALVAEADRTGWRILDLARAAGDPATANRVGDNVFTTYPVGEALARERSALVEALAR